MILLAADHSSSSTLPLPGLRKSDLIYPTEPLTLTLDQPEGLCSRTETGVPLTTVLITFELVDGPDLRLTPSLVHSIRVLRELELELELEFELVACVDVVEDLLIRLRR